MAELSVDLPIGRVALRRPRRRDAPAWSEVRIRDREQLEPWEVLGPPARRMGWEERQSPAAWLATHRAARELRRHGTGCLWVVTVEGALAGVVELSHIARGPAAQVEVGYWVDPRLHGQGVGSASVALACDVAFTEMGLHRVQAFVRATNVASTRLLGNLGFRREGVARQILWVDTGWCDHEVWALVRGDRPGGVLRAWSAGRITGEQQAT
jgi:ribosomal-protein-alanine N-acetyltransferase